MLRVLGNLEHQAGCFAQLLIASVNPESGNLKVQKYVPSLAVYIAY